MIELTYVTTYDKKGELTVLKSYEDLDRYQKVENATVEINYYGVPPISCKKELEY